MKMKTTKIQKIAALASIFAALIFDPKTPLGYVITLLCSMLLFVFIADFGANPEPQPVNREDFDIDIEIPEESAADEIRRNHANDTT